MMDIVLIAKIAHRANKVWCEHHGDWSQKDWDDCPKELQDSVINGVKFHIDNPDANDAASHNAWLKYKKAEGYTYGPEKNVEAKTHPCLLPFEDLSADQQFKDKLFRNIVDAALGR